MSQASRRRSTPFAVVRSRVKKIQKRLQAAAESGWEAMDGRSGMRALAWTVVGSLGIGKLVGLVAAVVRFHGDGRARML